MIWVLMVTARARDLANASTKDPLALTRAISNQSIYNYTSQGLYDSIHHLNYGPEMTYGPDPTVAHRGNIYGYAPPHPHKVTKF